jgi:hypothetical protein
MFEGVLVEVDQYFWVSLTTSSVCPDPLCAARSSEPATLLEFVVSMYDE